MSDGSGIWWRPIAHFLGHVVVGTVIFLIVACASAGIWLFVHYLEARNIDPFIIVVLTWVERAILLLDVVLFMIHLASTAVKAVKENFR